MFQNYMGDCAAHHRGEGCINVKLQDTASHKRNEEDIEGERQSCEYCNSNCLHNIEEQENRWLISQVVPFKLVNVAIHLNKGLYPLGSCDHSYTQCAAKWNATDIGPCLLLQRQSAFHQRAATVVKYVINHVKNSGNTCSQEKKTYIIVPV